MIISSWRYFSQVLALYISALKLDIDDSVKGDEKEKQSITMAGCVVALTIAGLGAYQHFLQGPDVLMVASVVVLLILSWIAMTFIASTKDRIPLHLNLVSFWILITCLIVVIVRFVRPPPVYGATERFLVSLFLLVILVPVHVLRCKIEGYRKLLYTVFILIGHGVIGFVAAKP